MRTRSLRVGIDGLLVAMLLIAPGLRASDDSVPSTDLWSLQPLRDVSPPAVRQATWPKSPVDCFISAELERAEIRPSSPADKRTLLRRLKFDLVGLPSTPAEVAEFLADRSPAACDRLVDRLLASPRYGERWGRHWLDVARYADTKGYAFGEHVRFAYSYTYRDYVIASYNRDLPYDRFIVEQLAADQLPLGDDKSALAALGFLTLGRRFDGNMYDIVDDRIDVTCRGLMALTVTCARCHDHKYDPIPTADYYSLYGVFASSFEPEILPLMRKPDPTEAYQEFRREFEKHKQAYFGYLREKRDDLIDQLRRGVGDYLAEITETEEEPEAHLYLSYAPGELRPPILYRWYVYLNRAKASGHPVFAPWHRLRELGDEQFEDRAQDVLGELADRPASEVNPVVLVALVGSPLRSMSDVAHRYGKMFRDHYELKKQRKEPQERAGPVPSEPSAAEREVLAVLFDPDSPTMFPPDETAHLIDRPYMNENWKRRTELQNFQVEAKGAPPRATVLVDVDEPLEPRVFTRGDPNHRAEKVPRQWLGLLAGEKRDPFQQGSGRLELARAITSSENPLTARVLVNRVWLHHFGEALVRTAGDFGARSDAPTHPELLDYLARRFVDGGWSIKRLHRHMVLTSAYQQASVLDVEKQRRDPENRLVWRMNPKRLEWEVLRDALLFVGGGIDNQLGGRPVKLMKSPFSRRRTVYGFVDRQKLPGVYRMFDLASPDHTTAQRHETLVPQQALFLMNSDFVVEQSRALAGRPEIEKEAGAEVKVRKLYELVFSRRPDEIELRAAWECLQASSTGTLTPLEKLAQVLLMTNEFMYVE